MPVRARWPLVLVLFVVLLAMVNWAGRTALSRRSLPTAGAEWIWAPGLAEESEAGRFYLSRQFELPSAVRDARLLVLADEEYELRLNGTWLGSNRYAAGRVDAYQAGPFLRRGINTLLVELRSSRGIGGLLLNLEIEGEREDEVLRVVSDGSWGVIRRHRRGLFDKRPRLGSTESAVVVARPPAGRWGRPRHVLAKPTIEELTSGAPPLGAERIMLGPDNEPWSEPARLDRGSTRFRWWVSFDWGREVTGYLRLRVPPRARIQGLIFVGLDLPDPDAQPADGFMMSLEGRRSWTDSQPRRFRYATFVGVGPLLGAQVIPTDPETSLPWLAEQGVPEGVFGLEGGRLRSPLENEIWGKLEGVPGLTWGKER